MIKATKKIYSQESSNPRKAFKWVLVLAFILIQSLTLYQLYIEFSSRDLKIAELEYTLETQHKTLAYQKLAKHILILHEYLLQQDFLLHKKNWACTLFGSKLIFSKAPLNDEDSGSQFWLGIRKECMRYERVGTL